jgi:hypothetical protein
MLRVGELVAIISPSISAARKLLRFGLRCCRPRAIRQYTFGKELAAAARPMAKTTKLKIAMLGSKLLGRAKRPQGRTSKQHHKQVVEAEAQLS